MKKRDIIKGLTPQEKCLDRIVLTGFRATGKSTVGQQLAKELNFDFIDTDKVLTEQFSYSISDYVKNHGWPAFRKRESELLLELAEVTETVIATGGGAITNEAQWAIFCKNAVVVWLQASAGIIQKRLSLDQVSEEQRPALTNRDTVDEVMGVLKQREPLYRNSADLIMDTTVHEPEELVQTLLHLLEKNIKLNKRQATTCQEIASVLCSE